MSLKYLLALKFAANGILRPEGCDWFWEPNWKWTSTTEGIRKFHRAPLSVCSFLPFPGHLQRFRHDSHLWQFPSAQREVGGGRLRESLEDTWPIYSLCTPRLPKPPALKTCVCTSDDTSAPVHTCSHLYTYRPRPLALLWLAAAGGPVICCLVISRLTFPWKRFSVRNTWPFSRLECLSHRSPTATRFWGGWGRRWWPRFRPCGWWGFHLPHTAPGNHTQSISSPPDRQNADRVKCLFLHFALHIHSYKWGEAP